MQNAGERDVSLFTFKPHTPGPV